MYQVTQYNADTGEMFTHTGDTVRSAVRGVIAIGQAATQHRADDAAYVRRLAHALADTGEVARGLTRYTVETARGFAQYTVETIAKPIAKTPLEIWNTGRRFYFFSTVVGRTMPIARAKALLMVADGTAVLVQRPEFLGPR
jgi:hypothetical protein